MADQWNCAYKERHLSSRIKLWVVFFFHDHTCFFACAVLQRSKSTGFYLSIINQETIRPKWLIKREIKDIQNNTNIRDVSNCKQTAFQCNFSISVCFSIFEYTLML